MKMKVSDIELLSQATFCKIKDREKILMPNQENKSPIKESFWNFLLVSENNYREARNATKRSG
jgi:hypothetical protein